MVNLSRLPVYQPCLTNIQPITGGLCTKCGERVFRPYIHGSEASEARCGLCRRREPAFAKAVAYGSYDGGLRELIHLLKYEQVRPAAAVLGCMLAKGLSGLGAGWIRGPVLVVPVPLHARKLRQRGFNQSELIARVAIKPHALNPAAGSGRLVLSPGVLERRRETQSQTGLTRHQRPENIRRAFAVVRPAEIVGRDILLVDDVFTTGTTVSECAHVLRRAGASKIYVATVARTLKADARGLDLRCDSAGAERILAATG